MAAEKIGPPKQLAETDWKIWGINPDTIIMDDVEAQEMQPLEVQPAIPPIKCINCEE